MSNEEIIASVSTQLEEICAKYQLSKSASTLLRAAIKKDTLERWRIKDSKIRPLSINK